jgi:electron transfer flavoprotein alpha subunit
MTVFCLVETDDGAITDASLRALTLARGLAAKELAAGGLAARANGSNGGPALAAVVFGDPPTADLAAYGIPDAYAVSGIDGYAPQAWARALGGLLSPEGPLSPEHLPGLSSGSLPEISGHAVVAAGTDRGNEVLAHLGAITGLPMAANCTAAVDNGGGALELTRQRWAGLLLEEALLEAPVALLTVATDAVSPVPADEPTAVAVHAVAAMLAEGDLAVRAVETSAGTGGASLATARVVIGGGRGVGSADGFAPLEELAALLGGVVGVSRVVTSEGWRPHTQQVGQTGTKITPDLYLACGISGAIQHIAGCSGAKNIIAINTDPDAPMMTRADYAVVGNLHEVIPALVAALRERAAP